jgi:hypothetical protein
MWQNVNNRVYFVIKSFLTLVVILDARLVMKKIVIKKSLMLISEEVKVI